MAVNAFQGRLKAKIATQVSLMEDNEPLMERLASAFHPTCAAMAASNAILIHV